MDILYYFEFSFNPLTPRSDQYINSSNHEFQYTVNQTGDKNEKQNIN